MRKRGNSEVVGVYFSPLKLVQFSHSVISIRFFSNESVLHIRWPKYWSFSFSIVLPMNIQDLSPLGWTGWFSLLSKGLSRVFSKTRAAKSGKRGKDKIYTVFLRFWRGKKKVKREGTLAGSRAFRAASYLKII